MITVFKEPVRNANSWAPPQTKRIINSRRGLSNLQCNRALRGVGGSPSTQFKLHSTVANIFVRSNRLRDQAL